MAIRSQRESWDEMRKRMLAETSRFIEWGLAHPDEVIEIPAKPVGMGGFPKEVGEWFWETVLSSKPTSAMQKWREFFRRKSKRILGR
jgi:hypothetical protein